MARPLRRAPSPIGRELAQAERTRSTHRATRGQHVATPRARQPRRRLMALGVPYHGRLVETPNGLTLKISIGEYTKAQPGLIRLQP